ASTTRLKEPPDIPRIPEANITGLASSNPAISVASRVTIGDTSELQ
ncbi:hypothetical protein GWN63_01095, partial [Candidatus Bathyarchaeota archaeon]|nr:hypothetical protein [Candidatus Bathyarchaeota archaeon]NIU80834.1 hypothetical protein [Candidatus Bathyarchaeota archaeon]NIV68396.1 hypothetical protein [Candidatus Bathyarchaeota archaeon]NIW16230.1 hypothetical protein [Candidatus Bathyarchaeota archaeon]